MRKILVLMLIVLIVLLPFADAGAKLLCASCGGTGRIQVGLLRGQVCTACGGDGWLNDDLPGGGGGGSGGGGPAKPSLSHSKLTLIEGRQAVLTVSHAKKKVVWSSSKPSVVKVNKKGKITARKAGKATITAKVDGKTLRCKVTVKKKVFATSISLQPMDHTLVNSEELNIVYSISPNPEKITENYSIGWASSDPGVVTVDSEGKIRAVSEGSATVTATLKSKKTKSAAIQVNTESGLTRLTNWINAHGGHVQDGDNSISLRDGQWIFVVQDLHSYIKDTTTMTVDASLTGDAVVRTRIWGGYDGKVKFEGSAVIGFSQLSRHNRLDWQTVSGTDDYAEYHLDVLLSSLECLLKDSMGIGWEHLGTSY